jgi:hypothetical protein
MNTWWRRLHKRWRLIRSLRGPREWWLFVRALGFATAVPVFMRLPLPKLGRLLERRFPPACPEGLAATQGERMIGVIRAAIATGAPLVSGRCLTRGLTLYYFLRRSGMELALVFGAGYGQAGFAGHCWLVKDGVPFLERGDPREKFVVMYRLPEVPTCATFRAPDA